MLAKANQQLAHEKMVMQQLVHENMVLRAMNENVRLTHEHMVLRSQSGALLSQQSKTPVGWPHSQGRSCIASKRSSQASTIAGDSTSDFSDMLPDSGLASETDDAQPHLPGLLRAPVQTTVMMKNMPNNYTRKMLLEVLAQEGFEGAFDFIYLPIDFKSKSGLGYAFINMTSQGIAEYFIEHFTGFNEWSVSSEKVCQPIWSETLQGLDCHIERYRNSPVMHESVPDDQKPVLFAGTEQVSFPPPTKNIRAPRPWRRRH